MVRKTKGISLWAGSEKRKYLYWWHFHGLTFSFYVLIFFKIFFFFDTGSSYVAEIILELVILLPHLPMWRDYRGIPPCLASFHLFFFGGAKQVLYHLNHTPSPFCFSYFSDRMLDFYLGCPQTSILLISVSQVAGIRCMNHATSPPSAYFLIKQSKSVH
jgi:hypothetical protein